MWMWNYKLQTRRYAACYPDYRYSSQNFGVFAFPWCLQIIFEEFQPMCWRYLNVTSDTNGQPWASECPDVKNYKRRFNAVWHKMLYRCTHMATVGVKEIASLGKTWRPCELHPWTLLKRELCPLYRQNSSSNDWRRPGTWRRRPWAVPGRPCWGPAGWTCSGSWMEWVAAGL